MTFCRCGDAKVLIVDFRWYVSRQDEIENWCIINLDYEPRHGMVMSFNCESDLMLFLLKWN